MKTIGTQTPPALRAAAKYAAIKAHLIQGLANRHRQSQGSPIRGFQIRSTVKYLSAIALAFSLWLPTSAQENWQSVDPGKSLLKFENAKRYMLQQSKDWQRTLEQSEWMLDDGTIISFHVTRLGANWVLTNEGPTLEEVLRRAFPGAELAEIGEPFMNRERGTRGSAQWLRFRNHGEHCVLIRQYGWDDDTDLTGRVPMGNRVAVGHRCASAELSHAQIKELFERIDF